MKSYVRRVTNLGKGSKLVETFSVKEYFSVPHSWLGLFLYPARIFLWLIFQFFMLVVRITLLPIALALEAIKWIWGKNKIVAVLVAPVLALLVYFIYVVISVLGK